MLLEFVMWDKKYLKKKQTSFRKIRYIFNLFKIFKLNLYQI